MFSSPAPRATPRKSVFRGRGDTASVSRGTPSIASASEREPLTPSHRSSRLNALKRAASPTSTAGETARTARYEEGGERVFLAKDQRGEIYSLGGLPREVQQIVKNSDMIRNTVSGQVYPASGYALVTTSTMCIAWNYARRTQSSPTVYVFHPPPSSRPYPAQSPPPMIAALQHAGSGEPGVILVSTSGEVRFWENMSLALSNVDRYQGVQLDLGADDYADKIWAVESNTYLITTTSSLAFRLFITSHSGRQTPTVTPLMRPGGMFGRASPVIFSLGEDKQGITAVAADGGRLWVLAKRTAQKWQLGSEDQKYVQDVDLYDVLGNGMFPGRWSTGEVELEINDLVTLAPGYLASLVSTIDQGATSSTSSSRVSHAIVILSSSARNGSLAVSRVIPMSYSPEPDSRSLETPRLIIPAESTTAFVRFASSVLMVSLVEGDSYEETITLRDSKRNAFIGAGHVRSVNLKRPTPPLVLMPASGGLLGVETFSPPVSARGLSSSAAATARLKSKMEQAVFFGDRSENPLSFDVLGSGAGGDVAAAAEAVSAEILSCTSAHMPGIYELRPQLADRLARLKDLVGYIRRNGLLVKLPQASRRTLSRDGEKAKAAVDLWDYQNRLMDQMHSRSPQSLLSDSIMLFMRQTEVREDEDPVRHFFRHKSQFMDRLLDVVYSTFRAAIEALGGGRAGALERSAWVLEANRIFIIVVRAAAQYREDSVQAYEMDRRSPSIEQWTAAAPLMASLEDLYYTTETLIADRTRDLGSAIDAPPTAGDAAAGIGAGAGGGGGVGDVKAQRAVQNSLKNQMAELAAALCNNMEDKLRATSRHIEDGGEEQEGIALQRKWAEMRPRVIRPLVTIDRISHAYDLAEHHNDYETLVWLANHPIAGAAGGVVKLQEYIERFGEDFAFVLYQWYIDQGQQHALLSQDEVYGGLVTKFFAQRDYPELAWLHHLACRRYSPAAAALGVVDQREVGLDAKNIISSIGKLAAVAEMKIKGTSEARRQALVDFDDQLDLIHVQETLRSTLIASPTTRRLSPQDALAEYLDKNLTLLSSRPAFREMMVDLARRLVDGEALGIEGLVDVLTLKDNKGEEGRGDAAVALDRLRGDMTLPEGRKQVALLSIWRRVFIRDDWMLISNTAGKSEERIQALLRQTSTYATLRAISTLHGFPQSYILSPYTSAQPPLLAELTARFPDRTLQQIEALMADHEEEIRVLERYIEQGGLESRVKEVAELVKRDQGAGVGMGAGVGAGEEDEQGDVEM